VFGWSANTIVVAPIGWIVMLGDHNAVRIEERSDVGETLIGFVVSGNIENAFPQTTKPRPKVDA